MTMVLYQPMPLFALVRNFKVPRAIGMMTLSAIWKTTARMLPTWTRSTPMKIASAMPVMTLPARNMMLLPDPAVVPMVASKVSIAQEKPLPASKLSVRREREEPTPWSAAATAGVIRACGESTTPADLVSC